MLSEDNDICVENMCSCYDLMSMNIEEFNCSIIEHMEKEIPNNVLFLLKEKKYSEAFDLLKKHGNLGKFGMEYYEWYINHEDDIMITLADTDSYYLRNCIL